MAFTEQKRIFANFIFSGLEGVNAAIKAGYSARSARQTASRLKKDPEIHAYLAGLREGQAARLAIDSDQWLLETAAVAYSNLQDVVETENAGQENERIKFVAAIQDLPRMVTAGIKKIGHDSLGRLQVTMHSKASAQTNMGRHFGMFKQDNAQLGECWKKYLEWLDSG